MLCDVSHVKYCVYIVRCVTCQMFRGITVQYYSVHAPSDCIGVAVCAGDEGRGFLHGSLQVTCDV